MDALQKAQDLLSSEQAYTKTCLAMLERNCDYPYWYHQLMLSQRATDNYVRQLEVAKRHADKLDNLANSI